MIAVLPEYFDGQLHFVNIKLLILEKQLKGISTAIQLVIVGN